MAVRKKSRQASGGFYRSQPTMLEHVASSVNPFAPGASGKKICDENTNNTFTFQSRTLHPYLVNEVGSGYVEYYPFLKGAMRGIDMDSGMISASGVFGSSITTSETDAAGFSQLSGVGYKFRVVSWGVRIICLDPALTAAGELHLKMVNNSSFFNGRDTTTVSDEDYISPITHNMDLTSIGKHNGADYNFFYETAATWATLDADDAIIPPYRAITIGVLGAPPSEVANTGRAIFTVEVVHNIEVLPVLDSIGSRISTKAAPHHVQTLQAISNTRTSLPPAGKTRRLWDLVKVGARNALLMAGERLLGPLGNRLAEHLLGTTTPYPQVQDVIEVD